MKDKGNGNGKDKGNGNGKEKHEHEPVPSQAIITREPVREITAQPETPLLLAPVMDIALARRRLAEFQEFVRGYLVEGEDFGVIPGTPKPTLLKPGADKLCELYGLADSYRILTDVEDFAAEPALFDYTIECSLKRDNRLVSTGLGSCNSYESKYRWREAQRTCPTCGKATIIKGKEEYGGGWLCWTKKDGCGAKFADGDKRIEGQQAGRVPNEDTATLKNTILKMAKKRAKIDATLAATRSSGIFTQDMEDVAPPPEAKPPIQQPTRASSRRPQPPEPEPAYAEQSPSRAAQMAATITMPISGPGINSGQQKMLFAATRDYVKRHNPGWSSQQIEEEIRTKVKSIIKRFKADSESTGDIPQSAFDDILDELGAI